ncbi:MAG: Rossmann-like and DUF2520 domain-containing protein [Bacteroidota bacterium]
MPTRKIRNVTFFGAGKLASHLALALVRLDIPILQVYNRTAEKGRRLAAQTGADYISEIANITSGADLYIFALTDSVLPEFASRLRLEGKLVVHTSGSLDMNILAPVSSHFGVFYPLQSFSHGKKTSFRDIPVCIEANDSRDELCLVRFAHLLTNEVHLVNSEKRKWLHMAAVFAGNFSNFMYTIAEELVREREIPFELLMPLIRKTVLNTRRKNLFILQTGPAVREDTNILNHHRALLHDHPAYLEIYNLISDSIIRYKKQNGKL